MEPISKPSKGQLWTSYILQALVVLLFLMGAVTNLIENEDAVKQAVELGYPEYAVFYLGLVLLISTLLYAIPRTSFVGALLLTGWLGGAIATHVIHKDPLASTLFPLVFGILVWLCLLLRDARLRPLFSPNKA